MALEELECDSERVNLFTLVDGNADLFVKARNYTEHSKFKERLCVQRKPDSTFRRFDLMRRRLRIAAIHNEAKQYIQACDYIFLVEDDTIIPPHALQKLHRNYVAHPYAGFIEGVEIGRHGIPHIGAWRADDVYEPSKLETLLLGKDVEEIDAGGFYCALVKAANYLKHDFKPFGNNDLGPDVDFGIALRQQGLKNYIDWSVRCEHRTRDEVITVANTELKKVIMVREDDNWRRIVK
jgi:hypothetical protein